MILNFKKENNHNSDIQHLCNIVAFVTTPFSETSPLISRSLLVLKEKKVFNAQWEGAGLQGERVGESKKNLFHFLQHFPHLKFHSLSDYQYSPYSLTQKQRGKRTKREEKGRMRTKDPQN